MLYIIYYNVLLKIDLRSVETPKRMLLYWAQVSFSLPQGTSEGLFEGMNMENPAPSTPLSSLNSTAELC